MLRDNANHPVEKSWLDRTFSIFADVKAGEGATAALMLANMSSTSRRRPSSNVVTGAHGRCSTGLLP